ncbi:uncharacterized protein THITE_2109687 [Thermothielavioides terrestris NRRL 8126]|uniref:Uncharacterized protein n=1 Tax=Thermothielavioides terrestris (strain ATCC 38088 / NRRL 8126) TaxID=578455 RepID=G2QXJ1_THETT|nr:uncharacterized protein THITE_2109687 [Thermothielavioides terrestris NRRL 8126]AEO64016.1 hypothetical protein THITE_2109687 [Thermothielavioides terrestris NRRL 8126]
MPQSFRDAVVRARVHGGDDRFLAAIRDEDVCHLASTRHGGGGCVLFKSAVRGLWP